MLKETKIAIGIGLIVGPSHNDSIFLFIVPSKVYIILSKHKLYLIVFTQQ